MEWTYLQLIKSKSLAMQISVSRVGHSLVLQSKIVKIGQKPNSVLSVICQWSHNFINQAVKVPGVCGYAARRKGRGSKLQESAHPICVLTQYNTEIQRQSRRGLLSEETFCQLPDLCVLIYKAQTHKNLLPKLDVEQLLQP